MQSQPGSSMRRTPPGGPPVAVAFAEPDDLSWLQRLLLQFRARFRRLVR